MMMPDEIQVWLIGLTTPVAQPSILSPEEAARAARFIFDRDRTHFIVAHTALRHILSRYTGREPQSLRMTIAEKGKPSLTDYPHIRFNLSHSGSYAMLAVARDLEVGVDIERINPSRTTIDIAERFFAPDEVRELMAFPETRRVPAFFAFWSRKEAYIKARGEGLGIALDSFTVSLGDTAELRAASDRERWSMCALQAPDGYAAALVAEIPACRVSQLTWAQEA
jgi:4'-phosphopantetheinyl transferase